MSQRRFWLYGACVLLSLMVLFFAGCDQPVSSATVDAQAVYISADKDRLAVLTWQRDGSDEFQGEWISREMPDLKHFIQPKPVRARWSGKMQDTTTLSLTVAGSLFEGKVEDQHRLKMTGTNADGTFEDATWYKISQEQANQYQSAFDAYGQARLAWATLQQTVTSPPLDSSQYWYAGSVTRAQQYVSGLGEKRDALKRLERMCGTGLLADFRSVYPPDASQFVLSSYEKEGNTAEQNAATVVRQTGLWKDEQGDEGAWSTAGSKPMPNVDGVDLTWRKSPDEKEGTAESVKQKAQTMLSNLETTLKTDYGTMKDLKDQATQIGSEVEGLANAQGCP